MTGFRSDWQKSPDGVWVGPDYWANRLQDWSVKDGKLQCTSTKPMRTVHLMTRNISSKKGAVNTSVNIFLSDNEKPLSEAAAGVLIGAGHGLDYRSASLIFDSWGESAGIFVGLDTRGNLFVRDFEKENYYYKYDKKNNITWIEAQIVINVVPKKDLYLIKVLAINPFTNVIIDKIEVGDISADRIAGNIALVSHAGYSKESTAKFSFTGWKVNGSKIQKNPERNIGPVLTAQYTLSRGTLKLTAQMMPLSEKDNNKVIMQLQDGDKWSDFATSEIKRPSFTAHFRADSCWKHKEDVNYRLVFKLKRATIKEYFLYGTIRHDPVDKEEINMLSLSCGEQIIKPDTLKWSGIDGGYFPYNWAVLYPHKSLIENLKKFNADLLYFTGDQVYEGASLTSADIGENANLDYLFKWYLWCITYRDLTTIIPTITVPDNSEVYHGNLEGAGGKAAISHLPDPYNSIPVEQGIDVYCTDYNIGGLSLAIFEDLEFKSASKDLLSDAKKNSGWPLNPYRNKMYYSRNENAILLDDRQLLFLEHWADDWSDQTWMKAVLSQTLFTNLATLPKDSMDNNVVPLMQIPDSGAYAQGDKPSADIDSDGWPQLERDKVIRILRKAFAINIAGDQYMESTVIEPIRHHELSTGYISIIFNRITRDIELAKWPYYADPSKDKPFPFWPVRINQLDNYGKTAAGWLPELKIEGMKNPVIKIIREWTGEIIYSLRINGQSFQPKVFEMGNYRIEVGEPDENRWQKFEKVYPTTFREREPIVVKF
jgi:hypothetical protein